MLFRSNDTATTEIYTLSLHDALPIEVGRHAIELGDHGLDLGDAAPLFVDLKFLQANEGFA